MHAAISGPWARAKHVTTTKPAVSYVLSRLSAQASYHHLSTQLGLKVIPRQWTPRSAPPSRPQCWNTRSNKSQVSVAFVTAAAPGLWHTCGYTLGHSNSHFSFSSAPSSILRYGRISVHYI